jgi:hypothetical protein
VKQTREPMNKNWIGGLRCRASGQRTAKPGFCQTPSLLKALEELDTTSVAIHDLEAVETREAAIRAVASSRGRSGPRRENGRQPTRPLAPGEQSSPCYRASHCLLRLGLVSLDYSMAMRNPLNRRTRTRIYGGVAGCVKKTRKRHAVREMKEGPSEPSCRRGLQTAVSCFG